MKVLALDTTTRAGSVALVEDDRIIAERRGDPTRTHAERLPRDILSLLEAHGTSPAGVDLFAVASGPGSFTGLRVGIATIQGLAFVQRRRVAAVSALEALAQLGGCDLAAGAAVGVWMDAQRRDVFSALYRLTSNPPFDPGRLVEIEGPAVGDPATTLGRWERIVDARDRLRRRRSGAVWRRHSVAPIGRSNHRRHAAGRRNRTDGGGSRGSGRDRGPGGRPAAVRSTAGCRSGPREEKALPQRTQASRSHS